MMALPLAGSYRALLRPVRAFEGAAPPLGRAVLDMSLAWMPLAFLNAVITLWRAVRTYEAIRGGTFAPELFARLGANPEGLHDLAATLPPPPAFVRLWPWLLLIVPVGVLGTWLHHAVWDHMGLWMMGGLKQKRGFRTSLLGEAQALRIAVLGTLLGLAGFIPILGIVLALPLLLLDAYLWLFRGFALAARHGCEPWRGVAATVVHAVLLGCCTAGFLAMLLILLRGVA
jgi:hypothetical protein